MAALLSPHLNPFPDRPTQKASLLLTLLAAALNLLQKQMHLAETKFSLFAEFTRTHRLTSASLKKID